MIGKLIKIQMNMLKIYAKIQKINMNILMNVIQVVLMDIWIMIIVNVNVN